MRYCLKEIMVSKYRSYQSPLWTGAQEARPIEARGLDNKKGK